MAGVTRIALVGLRGTGKTTVGKRLAMRWGWSFVDTDDVVESQAGKTISRIFAEDGESRFRELEAKGVSDSFALDRVVLATGGGAILRPETCATLKSNGFVIWLTGSATILAERVSHDKTTSDRRPALTAFTGAEELDTLLRAREPFYREVAHLSVDTTNRTPDEIAELIERSLPAKG